MSTLRIFISANFFIFFILLLWQIPAAQEISKSIKVGPQPDGSILVPTNQLLRPAGFQVYFPGRPVDVALTPDKKRLLVKNRKSLDEVASREQFGQPYIQE